MEWSIQDIARTAGTTSRTLRHYGQLGLLSPSRVGRNGYRFYDQNSLVRLQRILLLRELGLGLPAIAEVLAGEQDPAAALRVHLELLEQEQRRISRQIESVRTTLRKTEGGEQLMAQEALDGFDHSQYEDEVVERWGRDAWDNGNRWWDSLGKEGQQAHRAEHEQVAEGLAAAGAAGADPASEEVQALVARHFAWVSAAWTPNREAYLNLGQMYVDDPRFAANYDKHAEGGAVFVRDAMNVYAERNL
jgi:DNA-binding transcriptional MerR regulator